MGVVLKYKNDIETDSLLK